MGEKRSIMGKVWSMSECQARVTREKRVLPRGKPSRSQRRTWVRATQAVAPLMSRLVWTVYSCLNP
jgi:hypothetical protein